jgi:hypothetical protein
MGAPFDQNSNRVRVLLLGAGAAIGLALAATKLVGRAGPHTTELPDNVVARVGSSVITLERYRAVLEDLDADRRNALGMGNRDLALQRLIDEELLVQQGVQMGLVESLPEVRKALVNAVIAQTVAEAEAVKPSEKELHELYSSDPGFFTGTARYRLIWLRSSATTAADVARAREARKMLLSGTDPDRVTAETGLEPFEGLPDALLPLSKLRDYLGPELVDAVSKVSAGGATGPMVVDGRVHVVHLVDYRPPTVLPFDSARPLVEAEFTRRRGDDALRSQLDELRRDYEIVVDSEKLASP